MPRTLAITAAAAALLALTACGSDTTGTKPPAVSSPTNDGKTTRERAGLPEDPTGQALTDYLAALRAITPALAEDEEDAVDNGVNQCSSLTGNKPVWAAQQRFGSDTLTITEAQAEDINTAVRTHICPK